MWELWHVMIRREDDLKPNLLSIKSVFKVVEELDNDCYLVGGPLADEIGVEVEREGYSEHHVNGLVIIAEG